VRIALLVAPLTLLLSACVTPAETHMHTVASLDPDARPDAATVVFVRAPSPCDEGSPFVIIDDVGEFVGESAPGTKFSFPIAPGPHSFVTWQPYAEIQSEKYPNVNQVGVVAGTFEAGRWYVVEVQIANSPMAGRHACAAYPWLGMRLVEPSRDEELAMALAAAAPVQADHAAGQAEIDAAPADLQRHLALGRAKLARRVDR
jgi:hypothetical protein